MSSFSLVISPPDGSRPGFIESSLRLMFYALPLRSLSVLVRFKTKDAWSYVTLRSATMPYGILSFGSWLEPRYIFAAGQLV